MTTPSPPAGDAPDETGKVDLGKHGSDAGAEAPFDPYRFGRPEHPVPPEFAPPGYVPDPPPNPQHGPQPNPSGGAPYGPPPNPYGSQHGAQPYHPYGPPGSPPPYQQYQPYQPYQPYGNQGYPPPTGNNGKAVTAMVLGIASIPLFFLTFLDLALIVPALIFGILGLNEAKRRGGKGRNQAVTGIVCLVVGALAATVFTVWIFSKVGSCERYLRDDDRSGYQSCVDNRFG